MEDKGNKKEGNGRGTNEEKRVKSGVEESTVGWIFGVTCTPLNVNTHNSETPWTNPPKF